MTPDPAQDLDIQIQHGDNQTGLTSTTVSRLVTVHSVAIIITSIPTLHRMHSHRIVVTPPDYFYPGTVSMPATAPRCTAGKVSQDSHQNHPN